MAGNSHFAPNFDDLAFFIDEKGRARDAHIGAAVILLFLPNAIFLANRPVLVRYQGEGQVIFAFEFVVPGNAILGNTNDLGITVGKSLLELGEFAGFLGAARRIVFGIKIKHLGRYGSSQCLIIFIEIKKY